MQDADESPDNNEQILTPLEGTKSHHEQTPSGSLERMLNRVNLENTFNTEKSDENKPKTEATTRVDLCLGFKNFEQENPTLVATQASQTKSSHEVAETKDESEEVSLEEHNSTQKGPVEPEGYQVCDMETGLCYWVPANKVKFEPDNATQEKAKQEDVSKEGIYDTRPSETSEQLQPQTQLEPVPAIGIADVPAIVTASTTEFDPEPQELDSHQYDQPHVKMTSKHSVDDDNTNSTDIEPSSSASASVRSLNPGPRLVGKLSPERLAMFEKNK
ncbi:hypothetical protein BCR41DRAFT_346080 [Lobosporangium transversale]|uniref:Uncharacterized protein n=1 Tax=Lobosporangium transversale TaxID=64571 RepID=A0A1Y2GZV6_9FUNG|nr:hypothetical protein BCR41DRAFT_346080 [Lobosporangium transversale]ORZ27837.1 hypothetical protein BCR41DRAFT_346080 [Lobosporangium transversale]|eukprot:XP_021885540.1 hypothetical protein BCR41DRAFT_346080 [Lobosporangium transversale]